RAEATMPRALAVAVVFAATTASAAPQTTQAKTAPQTTQAKADVLFEQGQAHYQAGEFQAAIPLFKEAYELVHDPVYLFNIAQSYRKVADCLNAFDYYNRYLSQDPTTKQRDKVTPWLRELHP